MSTPVDDVLRMLDENGYTGVVATNCEQTYHRYVRLGERPVPATRFAGLVRAEADGARRGLLRHLERHLVRGRRARGHDAVPGAEVPAREREEAPPPDPPKPATANAASYPLKPATPADDAAPRAPYPLRPAVNRDTEFFWEGVAEGELRIQKCTGCGELRHPPGPVCPSCRSADRTYVVAGGEGEVYSYVVHHHPPVPGREPPFVVALVELEEGVRMVGNVVECAPSEVGIGMPVRVTSRQMDDELILPMWIPREA